MEKEPVSLPEKYLDRYIKRQARKTASLAAKTNDVEDPVIEEAVFFDDLINFPDPFASHDYDHEWRKKDE